MSLHLSDRLSDRQKELLKKLGYYGNLNLSVQAASVLIDELIAQQTEEDELYNDNVRWITGEDI